MRLSNVVRSADWVKLQYENQKPLQTLVGPMVQSGNVQSGDSFSISTETIEVAEGQAATVTAQTDGAQKIYWSLKRNNIETIVAVDRNRYTFDAGRVEGDEKCTLQLRAVYPTGVRTRNVRATIKEAIAEPKFSLTAPADWDGRATTEVVISLEAE